ncbi:MAG TPA: type II toxin-antitoxin system RelE/ParE family toxin [Ktedonobacteraceae bacterium]
MKEKPNLKPVSWLGDSLRVLRSFPEEVQDDIGHELFLVQSGLMPKDAKPLRGIASGVFEIVTRFDGETYRTVYAVKIADKVYVLHIFQKKSKSGIKTPQSDIDLIVSRLKEAQRRENKK